MNKKNLGFLLLAQFFCLVQTLAQSNEEQDPCQGKTYTQGAFGAGNGNTAFTYLNAHFASAFPNGITIGCTNKLILTSPAAVAVFLPSSSTASALPTGTLVNP